MQPPSSRGSRKRVGFDKGRYTIRCLALDLAADSPFQAGKAGVHLHDHPTGWKLEDEKEEGHPEEGKRMEYSGYGNKGDSAKSSANWQSDPEQQCREAADGLGMSTRCTDDCKWFHACFECIKDLNLETDLPWSEGCLGVVDHDVTGTSERSFTQYHRAVVFRRLKGHVRGNGRSREQVDRDGGDPDPVRSYIPPYPWCRTRAVYICCTVRSFMPACLFAMRR